MFEPKSENVSKQQHGFPELANPSLQTTLGKRLLISILAGNNRAVFFQNHRWAKHCTKGLVFFQVEINLKSN